MQKKYLVATCLIAFVLLFSFGAQTARAVGISRDYLPNNTFKLHVGETGRYGVRLPNVEDETVTLYFKVNSTPEDIVKIRGGKDIDTYRIGPNSKVELDIDISVPETAKVGDEYNVKMYVEQGGEGEGQVVFGSAATTDFTVKVVEEGEESTKIERPEGYGEKSGYIYGAPLSYILFILVAAILIIAYLLYKKYGTKEKK